SGRRADDRDVLVVAALPESEAAVLLRDLDAERAQTAQSVDYVFRDLARALDRLAVDRLRELVEPAMELGSTLLLVGVLRWWRVDQIEAETSKEQLTNEARQHPLGLPRGLRDLACLALIDRARPGLRFRCLLRSTHHAPPLGRQCGRSHAVSRIIQFRGDRAQRTTPVRAGNVPRQTEGSWISGFS